jgi:hypothetical protein
VWCFKPFQSLSYFTLTLLIPGYHSLGPYSSAFSLVHTSIPHTIYLYLLGGLVLYSTTSTVDRYSIPSKGSPDFSLWMSPLLVWVEVLSLGLPLHSHDIYWWLESSIWLWLKTSLGLQDHLRNMVVFRHNVALLRRCIRNQIKHKLIMFSSHTYFYYFNQSKDESGNYRRWGHPYRLTSHGGKQGVHGWKNSW